MAWQNKPEIEFLQNGIVHSVGFYQKYCHFLNCASVASLWTFLSLNEKPQKWLVNFVAKSGAKMAIFLLKLCNFSQNFLLIMQFFAYWLCFSSFTENFPYFFAKYPHFGQNFWGSLKILKTTHKTGLRNDKDFSKKYTPMTLSYVCCGRMNV